MNQDALNIKRSLSWKMVSLTASTCFLLALGMTLLDAWDESWRDQEFVTRVLEEVVGSHREAIRIALETHDQSKVQSILNSILEIRHTNYVSVRTSDGIFEVGARPTEAKLHHEFVIRVNPKDPRSAELGTLMVESDLRALQDDFEKKLLTTLWQQMLFATFVGTLLFFFMNFSFIRPLKEIILYLTEFRPEEKPDHLTIKRILAESSYDEMDALVDHVNALKDRVMESHQSLKELNASLEARIEDRAQTILHQREKLESSARWSALGEMAGSIAHEINNPLAIIMGKAEILQRQELQAPHKKMVDSIVKTTSRIAEIVQSLRVLSRDASHDPFEYAPLSLTLKDALGLCSERLRQRDIRFSISPDVETYEVMCRRVQISQIFVNLIGNSIDALEPLPEKWIRVEANEKDGMLVVSVIDAGAGFPLSVREKIMTPFFTTKDIGKGTGLGLSLSRSIMAAHEGRFEIDFNAPNTTLQMVFKNYRVVENKGTQAA